MYESAAYVNDNLPPLDKGGIEGELKPHFLGTK
jgi:hypothetical protein